MNPLVEIVREYEAQCRWARGEKPNFSQGICGSLTCGYGEIDDYGYWEFPLYPAGDYVEKRKVEPRDAL